MLTAHRTWLAALILVVATVFNPASAHAQSGAWSFLPGAVLTPDPNLAWMSQSVGSPSVAYDSLRNRLIMVFETRLPNTDPNCPQGLWGLGVATSNDGLSWSVAGPLLQPTGTGGTYFECVAAHPAAVFVDDSGTGGDGVLQVYFKAEQGIDGCPSDPASCQYSGIGRLSVTLNGAGLPASTPAIQNTPVLAFTSAEVGGFPRIVRDGATFLLALQRYPDIHITSSTSFSSFPATTPAVTVGQYASIVPWIEDEFFNPAVVCNDSVAFPFGMFLGGRETRFAVIRSGAMAKAISANLGFWALSTIPEFEWGTDEEWRHWDVQRLTTGDYIVWFSEKDASGNSAIRVGYTNPSFNVNQIQGKICP